MRPANEGRRYNAYLIGWVHAQNHPCTISSRIWKWISGSFVLLRLFLMRLYQQSQNQSSSRQASHGKVSKSNMYLMLKLGAVLVKNILQQMMISYPYIWILIYLGQWSYLIIWGIFNDVMTWNLLSHCCLFVQGIQGSMVGSPHQGPLMWSAVVFYSFILNKLLTKRPRYRWFETPLRSCGVTITY